METSIGRALAMVGHIIWRLICPRRRHRPDGLKGGVNCYHESVPMGEGRRWVQVLGAANNASLCLAVSRYRLADALAASWAAVLFAANASWSEAQRSKVSTG